MHGNSWLRHLTVIVALAAAAPAAQAAALVLRNGEIYTSDAHHPWAQSIAIKDGTILSVGADAAAMKAAGDGAQIIDLQGKTVLPGIIDSHIHTALGEFLLHRLCNVRSFSVEEGYAKLQACARKAPPGDWVIAYGWYFTDNPKIGDVRLERLDAIVPDRKLAVISMDMHTLWVNSKSLKAFGITRNTPQPSGGRIEIDPATGEPAGVLRDAAHEAVIAAVLHDSTYAASTLDLYRTAVPYLNGLGITSILDALADDDIEAAYQALDKEGKLNLNVSLAFGINPSNYRTEIPRIAAKRAHQSAHTRVDYIKVFADGNIEDKLAFMLPQNGRPGTHGYYTQEQMNEVVRLAESHGLSIFVHVIGDGAARQVLDAIAAARKAGPCPACRHTLTHMQWVNAADHARFRALGVIANIQEGWIAPRAFAGPPGYDYRRATALLTGQATAEQMFPYGSLHRAGARLSAGSDWFFTNENPWADIQAGATSRDPGEATQKPMLPAQVIDLPSLIRARTLGAAYQLFSERKLGSLEAGKQADLVVLDRNVLKVPVEQVDKTLVLETFFQGRPVSGTRLPAAAH
jgi:predicted amidohydrolase YtcJ